MPFKIWFLAFYARNFAMEIYIGQLALCSFLVRQLSNHLGNDNQVVRCCWNPLLPQSIATSKTNRCLCWTKLQHVYYKFIQIFMPLLMDVLKYHISYQFKSKFEKLNKYSFAYNFFMDIGITLYHPFTEFIW